MKVFIIENGISKDIFVVRNKGRFCDKFSLTPRLLDYTIKGASSTRYQEYHKNYRIVEKLEFIEAKDGDRVLWDSGITGYCVREDGKHFKDRVVDRSVELENENTFLQKELSKALKQKQKIQDQLTLSRKLLREGNRQENTLDVLREVCVKSYNGVRDLEWVSKLEGNQSAVLVISDVHIGGLIQEANNYYDLEVATRRLDNIFDKFIREVELRNIYNVNVLLLGDLIHAGNVNRIDMKISSEFPEIVSGIKCFELLASQIDRLASRYNVGIASVLGNESRFNNHINPSNVKSEARNNIDLMIFEMLKQRYLNTSNVEFLNEGDELESVVEINGKRIAMTHGNNLRHQDLEKSTLNLRIRLENVYGEIDMVVLGHIHSTSIGSKYARNGSIPSASAYSNSLGIVESYVSQNMLIIDEEDIKAFELRVNY